MEVNVEPEQADVTTPTFTSCAARYIKSHRRSWRNAKHARQWVSTLKAYARPVIGSMPVDEVTTQDVLKILSPIWTSKTETAKRVQGRIENVLDYAAAHSYRDPVNPARWRGHLDKLLAKPARVKKVTHHPAMPYDDVAAFMAELQGYTSISSKALQFLIFTATRTSEVLRADWLEIDLDNETWTIPADRMKARREHRVPLSRQAVELLAQLPKVQGNTHVFPGARQGRPLSNMAMLQLMRAWGTASEANGATTSPTASARAFATGRAKSPAIPATSRRWLLLTPSRTRWRQLTAVATFSRSGGR
ncbi:tyrosine-type recombinase/integrase [Halomonas salinarum]|uniref:tyrosine-type recombinase/integrase n=1 Tax=Halomonas salinarum TaxID=1158993 RepID=UPI001FD73FB3|nr:tyrosine-type recombinase/integrase [Halomonas salinarum]